MAPGVMEPVFVFHASEPTAYTCMPLLSLDTDHSATTAGEAVGSFVPAEQGRLGLDVVATSASGHTVYVHVVPPDMLTSTATEFPELGDAASAVTALYT